MNRTREGRAPPLAPLSRVCVQFNTTTRKPSSAILNFLPGGGIPARRSTDIPDGLVCAARTALIPVSHRLPPRSYDEPESLSYRISSICPVSADGEHLCHLDIFPIFIEQSHMSGRKRRDMLKHPSELTSQLSGVFCMPIFLRIIRFHC